jgi:hypothetical protein
VTATTVNGVNVIADEPVSGIRPDIRKLLLDNAAELYGCQHCTFTAATPGPVQHHLKTCRKPKPEPKPTPTPRPSTINLTAMTVDQLLAAAQAATEQAGEVAYWRDKSKRMEADRETLLAAVKHLLED